MTHETRATDAPTPSAPSASRAAWQAIAPALRCPVGGEPLRVEDAALICAVGHSFDIARSGYVNLLRSQRRAAHRPGDTPAMLHAREAFLASGAYHPLADALAYVVADGLTSASHTASSDEPPLIADIGCGTGYYLATIGAYLRAAGQGNVRLLGIDAVPEAARLTARRLAREGLPGTALVADLWRGLPLRDGAVSVLLDVFAPRAPTEFARVLAPGGLLVVLVPQASHLAELRAVVPLLAVEADKEEHVIERLSAHFAPVASTPVAATMTLTGPALRDLVAMTPSARHISPEALSTLAGHAPLEVGLTCTLMTFQGR